LAGTRLAGDTETSRSGTQSAWCVRICTCSVTSQCSTGGGSWWSVPIPLSVWCTRPSLGVLGFNNNLLPSIHMLAGLPLCPALLTPITATIVPGLHGISLIVYSSSPSNVQRVVGGPKAQWVSNMFNALSSSLHCPVQCSPRNQSDGVSCCPSNVQGVVGVSKAQRVSMFNGPTCSTGLHQLTRAFNGHDAASHRPGQPSMSVVQCVVQETAQGPAPRYLGHHQVAQRPRLRPHDACTALGSLWAVIDLQSLREEGN
jgi:hypothetical protein